MVGAELRELPVFAGISDAGFASLATCAEVEVAEGQVLVRPGDSGSGMFVVLEGTAVVDLHGKSVEVGRGGVVGELALLVEDGGRVARARAGTSTRCLCIPRDTFVSLVETEPSFALALLRMLAARLHGVLEP